MAGSYQIQTLEEPSGPLLIGKDILPRNSAIGTKTFTTLKTDSNGKNGNYLLKEQSFKRFNDVFQVPLQCLYLFLKSDLD